MSEPTGNGLRKYMALWIFLAAQFTGFVWWGATLTSRLDSMQKVGGVPISTEARERLKEAETRLKEHDRRLERLENK